MSRPSFLFAPGAGAPSSHPWMQAWHARFATIADVTLLDYAYMLERRKRPDLLPVLIAAHRRALAEVRAKAAGPVFLVGKSMGGRVGCHVALEEEVAGVVCLGYPLCGSGDPTKLRDKVLRAMHTRVLFVQGTRDPLCPLDLLERVRVEMKAPSLLHVVPDGDHSLRVTAGRLRAAGTTQEQRDAAVLDAVARFVASP